MIRLEIMPERLLKGLGAHQVSVVTFEQGWAYWKISAPLISIKPRLIRIMLRSV